MDDQTKLKNEVMGRIVGTAQIRRRATAVITTGLVSRVVLYLLSLTMGSYPVSFSEALDQIVEIMTTGGNPSEMSGKVIFNLRMPRELAVIMVGAGLAIAGAVMQALIHNPLVDPYITGVSSGASFGVMLITISGLVTTSISTLWMVPAAGIVGAIAAFALTMVVAEAAGGRAMSYVLGGTVIGLGLSAGTTLIMSLNADHLENIASWMFGSFAGVEWNEAVLITVPIALIIVVVLVNARRLNVMLLGEDQAMYLGMESRRFKRNMLLLISVLTAFCVSFCGVIGFIGLIVPHLCRMVVGGDNRALLPTSMIVGPVVLMLADVFCKSFTVGELPIGAIISVIGVPFFVYLMVKEGKRYAM